MDKTNKNKNFKDTHILLSHGDGGTKTGELINNLILRYLGNRILNNLEDSAVFNDFKHNKIAYTTDSFVVKPIFFPGGDIGKLSICGTVNDLASVGASPIALSMSLIIEEGFDLESLEKILQSAGKILKETETFVVTGDTKVVERNSADKIFINTSGIGCIRNNTCISPVNIKPGDKILINGSIAEHGLAVLSSRPEFNFKTDIISDCAPLYSLVNTMLEVSDKVHALRDATRGGVATVLNEMAQRSKTIINIYEDKIPVKQEVESLCEFLGLDPLYIANEGIMVAFVDQNDSKKVLEAMKKNKYGINSTIIGEVSENSGQSAVILNTKIGTRRIIDKFYSEQLPRIC
ncbi:MAG: hydrogenase expression/formation protein HypE [Actinobacteria bacterium]|nr:hydrogenase expression/formation protein HypE [Actinomycetota bacterium]